MLKPEPDRDDKTNPEISDSQYPLPANTTFGKVVGNLDSLIREHSFCKALSDKQLRVKFCPNSDAEKAEYHSFLADIYKDVYSLCIEKQDKLAGIELTTSDILYLMGNPVGNIIRRPVIAAHFVALAKKEVKMPEASGISELVYETISKFGFSKFINSEVVDAIKAQGEKENVWIDLEAQDRKINLAIGENLAIAERFFLDLEDLAIKYTQVGDKAEEIFSQAMHRQDSLPANEREHLFYSDPGHIFNVFEIVRVLKYKTDKNLDKLISEVKLPRPVTLMCLEDNLVYKLYISKLTACADIKPFAPPTASDSEQYELARTNEGFDQLYYGIYSSAESALSVFKKQLAKGVTPDLAIVDIELGDDKMNGLQFVREAQRLALEAGKKIHFVFVTSSNMSFYRGEVAELRQSGLIEGAYRKSEFSLLGFLNDLKTRMEGP